MALPRLVTLHRLATPLAVGLLVGVLTACGGDPPSPPPLSLSPTPTVSETTQASESAEHFIRRWVQVDNRMQNTGDTSEYRSIAEPGCKACRGLADEVQRIYEAGGYIRTGGLVVRSIESVGRMNEGVTYEVAVDSAPTRFKRSSTSRLESFPGGRATYVLVIGRETGSWRIFKISKAAS